MKVFVELFGLSEDRILERLDWVANETDIRYKVIGTNTNLKKVIQACIVYSMAKEWDDEFQNYVGNDGKPIPEGYPIGFEIGDKLYLFDGVKFG